MNSVNLVGNICTDLDMKYSGSGTAVCKFTLAVNRVFKQDNQPDSDFLRIVVFGKQAENLANFQKKGNKISVTGSIQTGSYEKEGVKHYTTDIIANQVGFLTPKDSNQQDGQQTQQQYNPGQQQQQPLNQPMYGGNPNQPQGQFHTGGQAPQQSYQRSQQQQQQQNYTRLDEDPFANSKGPTNQEIEDSLPF